MSLAANDLPIQHHATKNVQLDPFDYASARVDLNDARERKLRADALLKKFEDLGHGKKDGNYFIEYKTCYNF